MTHIELEKLRCAYVKVYGDRWRELFAKYYWCVYDGQTGKCTVVKCRRCPHHEEKK